MSVEKLPGKKLEADPETWSPQTITQKLRTLIIMPPNSHHLLPPNLRATLAEAIKLKGGPEAVDAWLAEHDPGHMTISDLFKNNNTSYDEIFGEQ